MREYYGTKRIAALPMTRLAYNDYRGWNLPPDENAADEGYLVEYQDGGAGNHPNHKGYISWSPKAQFEAAYQPISAMSFGHAIAALKAGERVARAGWNGKGMWLVLIPQSHWETTRGLENLDGLPWIGMKTVGDKFVPWLASQTDMLADDWTIVQADQAAAA